VIFRPSCAGIAPDAIGVAARAGTDPVVVLYAIALAVVLLTGATLLVTSLTPRASRRSWFRSGRRAHAPPGRIAIRSAAACTSA
jgi:hypothetical protein